MKDLILILPEEPSPILNKMIQRTVGNQSYKSIYDPKDLINLQDKRIVFAVELNNIGVSNNLNNIFAELYKRGRDSLIHSEGIVLISNNSNLYSKTAAQSIVFLANNLGCSFIGRPLVEANLNLNNFLPMVKVYDMSLEEICLLQCENLGKRFLSSPKKEKKHPKKLLALHSSRKSVSNTLSLWEMVKKHLDEDEMEIKEINVGQGNIEDCKGCPYTTCKYFGSQSKCFYGGIVVEEVYPAIERCDSLILISPNYNDMVTANLVATINRLTALYRKTKFYDKLIFSIIVSGYSGNDGIAKQIISSLNMNKTFQLPPYFSLMETANDMGAILKVPNIEDRAEEFARNISNSYISSRR